MFKNKLIACALSAWFILSSACGDVGRVTVEDDVTVERGILATIDTSMGRVVLELDPERAPVTVANFIRYAKDGFYEGLLFHRTIPGFMIQGGGYSSGMVQRERTYPPITNEAIDSGLSNVTGTIAMARTDDPDSAASEFYINVADNFFLDPSVNNPAGYAVFGRVIQGMAVVRELQGAPTHVVSGFQDVPVEDIVIVSVTVSTR